MEARRERAARSSHQNNQVLLQEIFLEAGGGRAVVVKLIKLTEVFIYICFITITRSSHCSRPRAPFKSANGMKRQM